MLIRIACGLAALLVADASPAQTCSICNLQGNTFRQNAEQSKIVLFGTITSSEPTKDGLGGTAQFQINKVIKNDPFLADRKEIVLQRLVPVNNPKNPPRYLIFCDIFNKKLDPYRGIEVSPAIVDYLQGAMALKPGASDVNLQYFYKYVDHPDALISQDAFLELARAGDKDIGQAAAKFSPDKLRAWIKDPKVTADRLNLFAFLLGVCGTDEDASLLGTFLNDTSEKNLAAYQGVLSGYIRLRPNEGWDIAGEILKDAKKPSSSASAVIRALRFYHGWKPEESRRAVVRGLAQAIEQGDVADIAVEDLRRFQIWDLTQSVLAQYDKKSHSSPIVRRSIVRYALCCPRDEAREFITAQRKQDAELVKDVEESLESEKKKPN